MTFVVIKRVPQSRIPSEVYMSSTQYIGGGFSAETNDVLRGITFEEEKMLLPIIIGISNTSVDFVAKAREFHANIDIPVPVPEGRKLNISTRKVKVKTDDGEKEIDYPIVPLDYIYYKHCLRHGEVATSKAEADSHSKYEFYLEDAKEIMDSSKDALKIKNEMMQHVLKLTAEKDEALIKAVLIMAKEHTGKVPSDNLDENLLLLDKFATDKPAKFVELAKDRTVQARAFVDQLITYGIVRSVGNEIYDEFIGDQAVAASIPEFITYLSQTKNSAYKAQLQVKLKSKTGK